MPRLPRILAAAPGAPATSPPRASYNNAGASALADLARSAGGLVTQLANVGLAIQDDQAKDEAGRLGAGLHAQVLTLDQAARLPDEDGGAWGGFGVPDGETVSQSYLDRVTAGFDRIEREALGAATNTRTERYLKPMLNRLRAETLAQAVRTRGVLYRQEQDAEVAEVMEGHLTAAIAAPDERRAELIGGEVERYLATKSGVLPADTLGKLRQTYRESVAFGRASRAVDENPEQDVTPLLAKLPVAQHDDLRRYAAQVLARRDRDLAQAHAARDAALKQHREDAERWIVNRLDAGTLQSEDLDIYGDWLSSERLQGFRQALRASEVGGGPGDASVIREFHEVIYSVELDSEDEVRQASQALTRAHRARLVPDGDFREMSVHLQSLADRFAQRTERATARVMDREQRNRERQADAQERLADSIYAEVRGTVKDTLRVTSEFSLDFNNEAADVQVLALEDLARQTGRGRSENALAWWDRNKARYISRISDRANARMKSLRESLSGRVPVLLTEDPLTPEWKAGLVKLKASRSSYPSEAAWLEDVERARELWTLRAEVERLKVLQGLTRPREAGQ